jgi:hypothetical protein
MILYHVTAYSMFNSVNNHSYDWFYELIDEFGVFDSLEKVRAAIHDTCEPYADELGAYHEKQLYDGHYHFWYDKTEMRDGLLFNIYTVELNQPNEDII